ncbi:MAG: RluA family pseudouridine synthase, partial [Bacteroidota bacterium]
GAGTLHVDDLEEDDDPNLGLSTVNAAPAYADSPTIRPGLVHRLDKGTSGLLVVAKHDAAHAHLARQFYHHTVHRRYLALVWGVPDPPTGTVDTHLGRDPRDRKRMAVVPEGRGKHAITHFETVEVFRHLALLRFRLETGRTHQIRVHARHQRHPVFGDATYDGRRILAGPTLGSRKGFIKNLLAALPRQALHAHTLGFVHPTTGQELRVEAELPDDFAYVLDRLRTVEPV